MNNRETDGYIIVDMKGIDVSRASQSVPGLYEKVSPVLDANKLVIVNNAGNHTPLPGSCIKSSNYIRITTDIYIFTINSNNILIIEANGSSITVDVSIVPTYAEGTKVADFEINGQSGEIYIPAYPDIINDSTASDHTVYSSDKVNTLLSGKADTNSIPTKTSDLQNDSGFITSSDIPAIPDELNDLDDVSISSATDSQVLTFDAISGKWVNATSPSGVTELSQLSDVTVASIADGEVLTYDSTSSKWKNEALPSIPDELTDLSDIAITSASNGEVLTYDETSSKWVNADIFDAPAETITASDTIVFTDVSDSNKPKSTTAAAVAGLANVVESDTYTIATYGGSIEAKKCGNVVTITALRIGTTTSIQTGNEPTLYTLPSKYRPTADVTALGFIANNFNYNKAIGYTITTNGVVQVYAYQDITNGRFTVTYIT